MAGYPRPISQDSERRELAVRFWIAIIVLAPLTIFFTIFGFRSLQFWIGGEFIDSMSAIKNFLMCLSAPLTLAPLGYFKLVKLLRRHYKQRLKDLEERQNFYVMADLTEPESRTLTPSQTIENILSRFPGFTKNRNRYSG